MPLEDIVSVTITAQTTTPTRLGFGIPLIARYHTAFAEVVREFKTIKELTDAGLSASDPAVLAATAMFAQNPRPKSIKVGKRALAFTDTWDVTPKKTTTGYVYNFYLKGTGTSPTLITYTVPAMATVASIVTALQLLCAAVTGVTATDNMTKLTLAASTAGKLIQLSGIGDPGAEYNNLTFKCVTADPGIATDLTAIEAADAAGWYGLLLDSNGKAEVLAAAAWIETRLKLFGYNTSDTEILDNAVTTDVMSTLKGSAYARTFGIFVQNNTLSWAAAAWVGNRLPRDPGSSTWSYKTLPTVPVDTHLTGGQTAIIESKNGNHYTVIAGVNITRYGIVAANEYIDQVQFIDWLGQRMKERVFGVLVNNEKIPYTDGGVDVIRAQVLAQLQQGIAAGGLAATPAPTVTAPKVADIDVSDKGNRILPDVKFTGTLAGAIHKLEISGVLSL